MRLILFVAASALASGVAAQGAPPPGASSCGGCHGDGPEAALSLDGLAAEEIAAAMEAFRSGAREATVMDRIAKGFDAPESAAIADWLAREEG